MVVSLRRVALRGLRPLRKSPPGPKLPAAPAELPKAPWLEFEMPLTGVASARVPGDMVLLLLAERERCVRERDQGRGCPLRLVSWTCVLAGLDAEIARVAKTSRKPLLEAAHA